MNIRGETPADFDAIRRITEAAFAGAEHSSGTEARIIDALRATGRLSLSLVTEAGGRIAGHVAFSPVTVGGRECGWFGLGPVAVAPEDQGRGIGAALIREGLAQLRARAAAGCVVLGDPGYYRRFGFTPDPNLIFPGVPPEYFLRLVFSGPVPAGEVRYQPAFYES